MRLAGCLLLVMGSALVAVPCWAQPATDATPRAAAKLEEGRGHYRSGRYQEAAQAFAAAHALSPNAGTKQNEAAAWQRAGQPARAADAYAEALAMGSLDEEFAADSRRRLEELERKLAVLAVEEPRGGVVSVAHARGRRIPALIHLEPGVHDVEVRDAGGAVQLRRLELSAGRTERLSLAPPPAKTPAAVRPAARPVVPKEADSSGPGVQRIIGFFSLGLGAATGIASAVLGVGYLNARSDFADDPNQDLLDDAERWQTATTATFYPAAGLTVLGAVLLLTAPSARTDPTSLELGPARVAVRVAW